MAYEFLNETTYSNDPLATGELFNTLLSSTEPGEQEEEEFHDTDLIEILDNMDEEDVASIGQESEEVDEEEDDDVDGMIDPELMAYLFEEMPATEMEGLRNANTVISDLPDVPTGINWLKKKTNAVNIGGLSPTISKYLNTLPDHIKGSLVATSGNDDDVHKPDSKHYSNKAIDLRYNKEAYNYILNDPTFKKLGLKMPDSNHGTAPHLHIEEMKHGGRTLIADSEKVQRIGLNNPNFNTAFFPLKGTNTFRGLDNNQPVAVTDGSKYKILVGKNDTAKFKGNVYEQKL
jgi:hypothetical protein